MKSQRAKVISALGQDEEREIRYESTNPFVNFVYHHKFGVGVGIFLLILAVSSVAVFFMSGGRTDVNLMYAGPAKLSAITGGDMVSAMRSVRTEEGAGGIFLTDIAWSADVSPEDRVENAQALEEFRREYMRESSAVLLLTPELYNEVKGSLVPLSEVFGDNPPESSDGYSVRFGDTDFYSAFPDVHVIPRNTRFCLRDKSAAAFFKDIIEYKKPEESTSVEETTSVVTD